MTATTAWAIKAPDGVIEMVYMDYTRNEAINAVSSLIRKPWKSLYRKGYRCVRVEVRESEEG